MMNHFGLDIKKLLPSYLIVSNDTIQTENEARQIARHFNPADVFFICKQENRKEIVVEDIENLIRQSNLSTVGEKKIFIVFNAELMNTSAQNKLLKTIEDTANSTVFFLCSNENAILQTVKSRSVILYPNFGGENQTLLKLYKDNADGNTIYSYAKKLITECKKLDDALPYIPLLTKPENSPLVFDALTKAIKPSPHSTEKKYKLYNILADIQRNVVANCNPVNAFDLLLIELFSH
jgi:hypothetical protein